MIDTPEYDIAPLSWIKTEIDHSLQQVYEVIIPFKLNEDDPATLRQARTYLHQVTGAVEMVDLPGVALVCREMEKLTEALEQSSIEVNRVMLDLIHEAGLTIEHHLDELLKNKPNLELLLFPIYQQLREAQGITQTNESDLFFPDMGHRAPSVDNTSSLSPAERIHLIKKSRISFQRGLLDFLRQQHADQGLATMRSAVSGIETAMTTSASRTFWWGTCAFVDCLINHSIDPTFAVKQLCARIDLQMRRHIEGSHKIAERLLRDLLYFIAQSRDVTEHVTEVKEIFNLTRLIPSAAENSKEMRELHSALKKILLALNTAKELWIKFASGNQDSLPSFQAAINELQSQTLLLNNTQITKLINEIQAVSTDIPGLPPQRQEAINLEVATTLLFLQNNLEHYEDISGELIQQVEVQSQRLRSAAYSEINLADVDAIPLLDEISRQAQEKLLIAQVAQEIQFNIQKIEESLDSFFRDELHDRQLIAGLNRPLTEIQGALSIMQLDAATQVLERTHSMIAQFSDSAVPVDESLFPVIADAISSISLYVDAQRYQRPEAIHILQPILIQFGLIKDYPAANPVPNERIEDDLQALKTQLHHQLNAWKNFPDDEDAKKKLFDTLQEINQDAELVGDVNLKIQIETVLKQFKEGNSQAALEELARQIGISHADNLVPDIRALPHADEIDAELLEIFLEEASDVLAAIQDTLKIITQQPHNLEAMRTTRRGFHTLKGSGRMVGLNDLGEAAWAIEQLLNLWLQDEKIATPELITLLDQAYPLFLAWIYGLKNNIPPNIDHQLLITNADQLRLRRAEAAPEQNLVESQEFLIQPAPDTQSTDLITQPHETDFLDAFGVDTELAEPVTPSAEEDAFVSEGRDIVTEPSSTAMPDPLVLEYTSPSVADLPNNPEFSPVPQTDSTAEDENHNDDTLFYAEPEHIESVEDNPPDAVARKYQTDDEPPDERIAIGTNLISPMLLDIFLREAHQHYQTLRDEFDRLHNNPKEVVNYEFMRAAHTLAGIASLTGFQAIADLAHALEAWLNRLHNIAAPLPPSDGTTDAVISRIASMLENVSHLQSPSPAPDLIAQLTHVQVNVAEPTDDHLIIKDLDADDIEIEDNTTEQPLESLIENSAVSFHQPSAAEIIHPASTLDALLLPSDNTSLQHTIADDVDEQLLPIFLEEATDLMPAIEKSVRNWRQTPGGEEQTNIQRLLHTLKGSARMAGAMRLGELTHTLETEVIDTINKRSVADSDFDRFETQLDQLNIVIEQLRHPVQPLPFIAGEIDTTHDRRKAPQTVPVLTAAPLAASESESSTQTLRVRADTVDRLVNEAGEINITRSRLESSVANIRLGTVELIENTQRLRAQLRELEIQAESQMQSTLSHMRNEDAQFDPLEFDRFTRLQELTRMIAESVNDIGTVQQNLSVGLNETDAAITQQGRLAKDLQQALMHIRMVPLASISDRLHRTVRLAAKDLGKKASLQMVGAQVEFDRGVLDKIVAPLEHLLRNSVAHGIEMPQERLAANKSEYGEIVLYTRQEGNEIIIALRDDGHGLNLDAIRTKAIENNLITADADVTADELMQLIFTSGFSTAESVTTLSGRGVGMDVVKSEITQLGGRIDLASETGKGVQFSIYLPLTLAVSQTVMVTISDRIYAIPSATVDQVQEYKTERLNELLAAKQISWQNNQYDFFYLPHLLGDTHKHPVTQTYSPVLLLRSGNQRVAILVDHLTGNQEVVVKNIGPQLSRVLGIAGATVMGNGQIVLILNPVQLAQRQGPLIRSNIQTSSMAARAEKSEKQIIMVVDDSLTVRKIASRMLNREGYEVITAKDGIDALQLLQNTLPDVMLLDIEMPRMDGFELTKIMRADHKMANIPIIMITSRTADKHRDHAFSLGVNAYMGKPYQDEVLLEKIRELSHANATV